MEKILWRSYSTCKDGSFSKTRRKNIRNNLCIFKTRSEYRDNGLALLWMECFLIGLRSYLWKRFNKQNSLEGSKPQWTELKLNGRFWQGLSHVI